MPDMHVIAASGAQAAAPPIVTTFSTGAEGWSVLDLSCNSLGQALGGGPSTWIAKGGAPGGFLRATDPDVNCYSYESPAAFEGDRSAYLGGELRWWIRTCATCRSQPSVRGSRTRSR
ncbi:MAG: hypothetical protein SGJ11_13130 [Phycisphaerae bacterium]|nr:hypothetical protein [Phycisphaerae bacterium]